MTAMNRPPDLSAQVLRRRLSLVLRQLRLSFSPMMNRWRWFVLDTLLILVGGRTAFASRAVTGTAVMPAESLNAFRWTAWANSAELVHTPPVTRQNDGLSH